MEIRNRKQELLTDIILLILGALPLVALFIYLPLSLP